MKHHSFYKFRLTQYFNASFYSKYNVIFGCSRSFFVVQSILESSVLCCLLLFYCNLSALTYMPIIYEMYIPLRCPLLLCPNGLVSFLCVIFAENFSLKVALKSSLLCLADVSSVLFLIQICWLTMFCLPSAIDIMFSFFSFVCQSLNSF